MFDPSRISNRNRHHNAADRQFIVAGNWALASDGVQWILQRRRADKRYHHATWTGVSFIRSTKDILARCMREKGVPGEGASRLLAGLPDHFEDWAATSDFSARRAWETGPEPNRLPQAANGGAPGSNGRRR